MKKLGKSTKKGFTLVELIVVLVILAVLAAMLVPALVGYIDRAKKEKEYQTAATVYGAAQAIITEQYGKDEITAKGTISKSATGDQVIELAGVDANAVTAYSFSYGDDFIIGSSSATGVTAPAVATGETAPTGTIAGYVTINGSIYFLEINNGVPKWTACKAGSTSTT